MSCQLQPTPCRYRVRPSNANGRYWKYIPDTDRWIDLVPLESGNNQFLWEFSPVNGRPNFFTMRPVYDVSVGMARSPPSSQQYRGYGFVKGQVGPSANWNIVPYTRENYAKIHIENSPDAVTCLAIGGDYCVHFHRDGSELSQRWVFERV